MKFTAAALTLIATLSMGEASTKRYKSASRMNGAPARKLADVTSESLSESDSLSSSEDPAPTRKMADVTSESMSDSLSESLSSSEDPSARKLRGGRRI